MQWDTTQSQITKKWNTTQSQITKKWDTTQSQITKKWNTTQSQKECLWASCSEVDEPRAPYQSEMREKPISYINTYTWNLENGTDEPICRNRMETQM